MKTPSKIAFYIVAHADDWQLFMNPDILYDLLHPACKVVFVVTTAGDAGMSEDFWRAREEGSKNSIRFCHAAFSNIEEFCGCSLINRHAIHYSVINNTKTYFLRLPDGGLDGNGFNSTGNKSLIKLESGELSQMETVEGSAVYSSWQDFVSTLESLIKFHCKEKSDSILNYINPSPLANPNDHPDHISTGRAVQKMSFAKLSKQRLFMGYCLKDSKDFLTREEAFWKNGMMAVYDKTVFERCNYSTLREDINLYMSWCERLGSSTDILPLNN